LHRRPGSQRHTAPAQPKIKSPRRYLAFALPESALRSRNALPPSPKRPPNSPANPAGSKCAAVNVSGDYQNSFWPARKRSAIARRASALSKPRHAPTDVQRSASFRAPPIGNEVAPRATGNRDVFSLVARIQSGSCAPHEAARKASCAGGCGKRQLVLAFGNVGDGLRWPARLRSFAHGHPKGTIDLFGWNYGGEPVNSRRGNNQNTGRILQLVRPSARSPLGHSGYSFSSGCSLAKSSLPMFASGFDDFPAKPTGVKARFCGAQHA